MSMPDDQFPPQIETLSAMLQSHQIAATAEQIETLDQFRRLLWTWNERMNLTRHTTLEKFVERDVIDSHELCKLLERGERVLDVGTGGGVPGLIVAILRPDLSVSVCDSTQKKARAVEAIVGELGMKVRVFPYRAEEVLEVTTFDTLIARALAPLGKVLGWLRPHWNSFDRLLLIKGKSWTEERDEARRLGMLRGIEVQKTVEYLTPRNDAQSVILSVRSNSRWATHDA